MSLEVSLQAAADAGQLLKSSHDNILALLAAVTAWALSLKISRYVSLSSIIAGWVLPVAVGLLGWRSGHWNPPLLTLALVIAALVTVRHRTNLARIAAGTEPKAGARRSAAPPQS